MVSWKNPFLIGPLLAMTMGPASAAPWVRGFVVDNYEPAFYYGGRGGTEAPGSDCPKGTIPILDYKTVLKTSWRTDAEIANIIQPVSEGGAGERVVSPADAASRIPQGHRYLCQSLHGARSGDAAGHRQDRGRFQSGWQCRHRGIHQSKRRARHRQCLLPRLGLHHVVIAARPITPI